MGFDGQAERSEQAQNIVVIDLVLGEEVETGTWALCCTANTSAASEEGSLRQ